MTEPRPPEFASLLRRYRVEAGFSQEELAERARLSPQAVSALERGVRRAPHRDTVLMLGKALALGDAAQVEFEEVAARARGRAGAVDEPIVRPIDALPNNLPSPVNAFVGRDGEVAEIAELLSRHRMVSVVGSGGIGKTRVALQVAAHLRPEFRLRWPDGVWLVEIGSLADERPLLPAIAGVLSVPLPPDGEWLAALAAGIGNKATMLFFDGCEHLISAVAAIATALLRSCPNLTIVATSREALRISGEATYRLPSLSFPASGACANLRAEGAERFGAIALFAVRARAVDSAFVLNDDTAPVVAEICRRLDGIALAIELAAARVAILAPRQLQRRLDERFHLLTSGSRDALPRQQTLRAMIDWSYDLLTETERTFFRRCGAFAGGFTLDAASAVCADSIVDELGLFETLASLVDKSLVAAESSGETVRYVLLESTRAYAIEKLEASGEREVMARRHLDFFLGFAKAAARSYDKGGIGPTPVALRADIENVRAALAWAQTHDPGAGSELAVAVPSMWSGLGLDAEGVATIEAFLATSAHEDDRLAASLYSQLAYLLLNSGYATRSFEAAQRAVERARAAGDDTLLIDTLVQYAYSCVRVRSADVDAVLDEAERIAAGLSAPAHRLRILQVRNFARLARGEDIGTSYERLRSELSALGDEARAANATLNWAEAEHARGRTQRAIDLLEDLLPHARKSLSPTENGMVLCNLSGYLAACDDTPGARRRAAEAIEILGPVELRSVTAAIALEHCALALALENETDRAARLLGYCDRALASTGFVREHTERVTHDRLLEALRASYNEEELEGLVLQGAALGPQRAFDEAFSL